MKKYCPVTILYSISLFTPLLIQLGLSVPSDWSYDWAAVDAIGVYGVDAWPITQIMYFYVYK